MIRATQIHPAGQWSGEPADRIVLDYDQRHRRRMAMTGAGGLEFLLDLAQAVPLATATRWCSRMAASSPSRPRPSRLPRSPPHTPTGLLRVAWHLGNRHLPTQLLGDRLRIRRDHVIEDMVAHLGATVTHIKAPFDPEGGAYAHGHHHHDDRS